MEKEIRDLVILVDPQDSPVGFSEKINAHLKGLCHRAFSVFIYRLSKNEEIEFLLHQRAAHKYHTPNLWTNTCCSHPRPGEEVIAAGQRRLKEEMGISTGLRWVGKFYYLANFENGLVENEVDHVLVGTMKERAFEPNSEEVQAFRWVGVEEIEKEVSLFPHRFTPWFKQAMTIALKGIE